MATKSSPEQPRYKQIELGGVRYQITVSRFDENYRAEWTCDNCGESGAWAPIGVTVEGAIELAKLALRIHHSLVHGDSLRPPKRR